MKSKYFLEMNKRNLIIKPSICISRLQTCKNFRWSLACGVNLEKESNTSSLGVTSTNRPKVRAVSKYIRGAPSKLRRVLDTIRGRTYGEALMVLEYMPYRACKPILKCLMSAASNAKNNFGFKKNNLYVRTAFCDMGRVLKRYRPRAQGKAYRIRKPTYHITIVVDEISATLN